MWLGRGYGSNGIRALGRGPRASAAARAWRASVALQRQVLVLVRAATGGARSLQAQLQVELHVEVQVGPQRELRGVGQIVVRALLGRDRVRASPGAARRDISRAIAPIAGIDIVVIAFKQTQSSACTSHTNFPYHWRTPGGPPGGDASSGKGSFGLNCMLLQCMHRFAGVLVVLPEMGSDHFFFSRHLARRGNCA